MPQIITKYNGTYMPYYRNTTECRNRNNAMLRNELHTDLGSYICNILLCSVYLISNFRHIEV